MADSSRQRVDRAQSTRVQACLAFLMAKWRMLRSARTFPLAAFLVVLLTPLDKANAVFFVFNSYDSATPTCQGNLLALAATVLDVALMAKREGKDLGYVPAGTEDCRVMHHDMEIVTVIGTRSTVYRDWGALLDFWSRNFDISLQAEWRAYITAGLLYVSPPPKPPSETMVGRCSRPLDLSSFGDNWRWIRYILPKHHDVRTRKTANGTTTETTRGFFAVDMGAAIGAYIMSVSNPSQPPYGYVAGEVRDTATTAGSCSLSRAPADRYKAVLNGITAPGAPLYHLRHYNCQHWASDKLGG